MSLTFQRSFKLELENVVKILDAAAEIPFASRHEIAEFTSIPIGRNELHGKVDPTIIYATYCGLIQTKSENNQKKRELTNFGEIVYEIDSKLRKYPTQMGIHQHLCDYSKGAPAWSYFIHEFLPFNENFTKENLNQELQSKFKDLSPRYIDENERTILQCYTEYGALGKLKIIESFEKDRYLRGKANFDNPYIAGYILAEIWEAKHPDKSMIDLTVLQESGHFATTMNLNEGDLQNCLNEMSAIPNLISQRREAPPFVVVRHWTDKFDLLRRAYEVE